MWFFLALLGYGALAVTVTLDKFILTKSVSKPIVYAFYSTIFMFGVIFLWPFAPEFLRGWDWFWALISGVSFGFALWFMYIAAKTGEASHINPFIGALIAVFTYMLAFLFLGERLGNLQILGIVILVVASLILSFERTKLKNGWHIGYVFACFSGLFFAVSHVAAKYLYDIYEFLPVFIWTRFFTGLFACLLLFSPSIWKTFKRKKKKRIKTKAARFAIPIVFANKTLGLVGVVLVQYAIAIGSVSLVNAMAGTQFVIMFILILGLTKFYPSFFKEYFTKREIWLQISAIILVVVGLGLFVF